jgi:hypothetical protein
MASEEELIVSLFSVQVPGELLSYFKIWSAESTLRNDGAQKRTVLVFVTI